MNLQLISNAFRSIFESEDGKVDRLAREALTHAADEYENDRFGWVVGTEFEDGSVYAKASRADRYESHFSNVWDGYGSALHDVSVNDVYDHALRGCALGGIARSSYIVCGRPTHGTSSWDLKLAVEDRAEDLYVAAVGYSPVDRTDAFGVIYRHNDSQMSKWPVIDALRLAAKA